MISATIVEMGGSKDRRTPKAVSINVASKDSSKPYPECRYLATNSRVAAKTHVEDAKRIILKIMAVYYVYLVLLHWGGPEVHPPNRLKLYHHHICALGVLTFAMKHFLSSAAWLFRLVPGSNSAVGNTTAGNT